MDEVSPFSEENKLSPEDQAVLDAFLAMEDMEPVPATAEATAAASISPSPAQTSNLFSTEEDTLVLFVTEADEDIGRMRQALQQLEHNQQLDSPAFTLMQRAAHKLKGTAGAMGCNALSAIARHIEVLIKQVKNREIAYGTGLLALTHAVQALETTLESVVSEGSESQQPLIELEEEYRTLSLSAGAAGVPVQEIEQPAIAAGGGTYPTTPLSLAHINSHHLDQLMLHTEQMLELQTPLESAQQQVEAALSELQNAQARLRHLEAMYSSVVMREASTARGVLEEQPASSLIERILSESIQRTGHTHKFKATSSSQQFPVMHALEDWDELEVDRFSESNVFAISLNEAITDVAIATAQLRQAVARLNSLLKQHKEQAAYVHNDALSLHTAPFSILVDRLRNAARSIAGEKRTIQFEVSGETTEIDQDILHALANPLLDLVTGGVLASVTAQVHTAEAEQITLAAYSSDHEVAIEAGFSMPVPGGIIEALNSVIDNLYGSITPHRDSAEGIAFQMRFPRSRSAVRGLLVRTGNQSVVVPFSQVHHIDYNQHEVAAHYDLNTLLDFPATRSIAQTIHPRLILARPAMQLAVQVDEILGQVDLVMRPLADYLRRPGILGTAIDGTDNILLVVDLPALITHSEKARKQKEPVKVALPLPPGQAQTQNHREPAYSKILIADDSVSIRQSLRQTLGRAGYQLYEARDGIEALELIQAQSLDILLLDVEMPNLNGFDLLTIMHTNPSFPKPKTILLTSRSADKHIQQAFALGVYDFLSKPCPADILLNAVQAALDS
ncbi:MAG TPA: response regulator [Ktedonobacteraceae bacterium]|jgi:chemosensory pili system protein ChpA (sensor histidine kinase/response regulator)|nr:response regulator [Ktedonobacteraceae bacterium]